MAQAKSVAMAYIRFAQTYLHAHPRSPLEWLAIEDSLYERAELVYSRHTLAMMQGLNDSENRMWFEGARRLTTRN